MTEEFPQAIVLSGHQSRVVETNSGLTMPMVEALLSIDISIWFIRKVVNYSRVMRRVRNTKKDNVADVWEEASGLPLP
jgi:hypothetical protein